MQEYNRKRTSNASFGYPSSEYKGLNRYYCNNYKNTYTDQDHVLLAKA